MLLRFHYLMQLKINSKTKNREASTMSELVALRPFVRLCQISGLFPFRLESDSETKHFKRFVFSFFHPLTFWYAFLLLLQITLEYYVGHSSEIYLFGTVHTVAGKFYQVSLIVMFVLLSILPLLSLRIRDAVKYVQAFDAMSTSLSNKPPFNVGRRLCFAVVYCLIAVGQFQSITVAGVL